MEDRILKSSILKRGYGTVDELLQEVSVDDFKHLQLGNYIQNGISNEGETFRLTKKGEKMLYFYNDKISLKDKILGWVLLHIFGINISI